MRTLFLFSKYFPFGQGEQYIENELPYLANKFDEIILYPTDYFGTETTHNRKLPLNTRVLDFNSQLRPLPKSLSDFFFTLGLVFYELFHSPKFFSELKRILYLFRIATHQFHTAKNLNLFLREKYRNNEVFLYSYWAHNNCVMLSALKKKNWIRHFVTRAHSIDLYYYDWALASELKVPSYEYTKFKYASHVYTISKHGEHFFKKKFPEFGNKVSCAYLGVSDMGENKLLSDAFTIVTCSNLSSNKRLIELAKAIEKLDIPVRWIHFGDGDRRKDIEKIAASLPAPNKLIILKGHTDNDKVRDYLVNSPVDLFVNLSKAEGLPVALMEAISAGIPVIATEVYGNPEVAVNNVNGYTIPSSFTSDQLAEKIKSIYSNPMIAQKFRAASRAHYLSTFTDKANYTRLAEELLTYPNKMN